MNYPAELRYSKSHEWIRMEDGIAVIGIGVAIQVFRKDTVAAV